MSTDPAAHRADDRRAPDGSPRRSRTTAARCTPTLNGVVYARHPVRTHLVTSADRRRRGASRATRARSATTCALVAVSERMVAITQGRSYPIKDIRAGRGWRGCSSAT